MSAKEPKSIQSLLLGQNPELSALAKEATRQVALRNQVAEALEAPMRDHVIAVSLTDATLTLICDSAPWAARIRFYAQKLLQNLAADHNLDADTVIVKVRPNPPPEDPQSRYST
ncbi:MAG: DciA family protein [Pseudomonadota bacterium]